MSSPQNAASETLHFHVTLYREGFGGAEDVFVMTYQHPDVAVDAVGAWVRFNENLIDLNYNDGTYKNEDQNKYEKISPEILQDYPVVWHDKSMYEMRIEHPARDGRYAGGRVTACDGEMISVENVLERMLAEVLSAHSPLGEHSAN